MKGRVSGNVLFMTHQRSRWKYDTRGIRLSKVAALQNLMKSNLKPKTSIKVSLAVIRLI